MRRPLLPLVFLFAICFVFCTCATAAGNGNNGNHYGRNRSVKISISPSSSTLQLGKSLQFSSSVSGTSDTSVNWLVSGTIGGSSATGTISQSGLYTAPLALPSGTITITAQSVADTAAMANA